MIGGVSAIIVGVISLIWDTIILFLLLSYFYDAFREFHRFYSSIRVLSLPLSLVLLSLFMVVGFGYLKGASRNSVYIASI